MMNDEPKAQKSSAEFWLFGQASSRLIVLQSLHFSQVLCDHLSSCILWSPPAVFRLVHMLGFPLHVHLYAPLGPPLPGAVPAPSETTTTMTIDDDWRGYEPGRVGGS